MVGISYGKIYLVEEDEMDFFFTNYCIFLNSFLVERAFKNIIKSYYFMIVFFFINHLFVQMKFY